MPFHLQGVTSSSNHHSSFLYSFPPPQFAQPYNDDQFSNSTPIRTRDDSAATRSPTCHLHHIESPSSSNSVTHHPHSKSFIVTKITKENLRKENHKLILCESPTPEAANSDESNRVKIGSMYSRFLKMYLPTHQMDLSEPPCKRGLESAQNSRLLLNPTWQYL